MRKGHKKCFFVHLTAIMTVFFLLYGCAGTPRPEPLIDPDLKSQFDERIDQLINTIVEKEKYTAAEVSPVTVMPGSLKTGNFTRLEELIMERLQHRLLNSHEIVSLSRNNWFEFRDGRPLSFKYFKGYDPSVMRRTIIYVVNVSADNVLEELQASITAYNSDSRMIAGMAARETLGYAKDQPARILFNSPPHANPFPSGLEENPYTSIDRICFSLAGELADAYKTGVAVGDSLAADEEIKVLLYIKDRSGVDSGLSGDIGNALQQNIISNRGFTCVVSQSDFGSAFEQIDFYKANQDKFDFDDSRFLTGTVFLMAEVYPHQTGDMVGVALRALWRLSPLETKSGAFIPEETAGTYLSGFTAKSYLAATNYSSVISPGTPTYSPGKKTGRTTTTTVSQPVAPRLPLKNYNLCFYGFTDPMERDIYPVVSRVPGLTSIKRADGPCDEQSSSVGYALNCRCRMTNLSRWLEKNLRTSDAVLPFKIKEGADNTLRLYYDGGWE